MKVLQFCYATSKLNQRLIVVHHPNKRLIVVYIIK